jgi:hypothetical protein
MPRPSASDRLETVSRAFAQLSAVCLRQAVGGSADATHPLSLAFDRAQMLQRARDRLRGELRYEPID